MDTARIPSAARLLAAAILTLVALAPAAAHAKRISLALAFGQDVRLIGDDTLSLRAQCVQNEGGHDRVRVYALTASDAILRGLNNYPGGGTYLTAATPAVDSRLLSQQNSAPGLEVANLGGLDQGAYVFNLATRVGYAIAQETSVLMLNLGGSDCHVSVDIETIKRFKQAK